MTEVNDLFLGSVPMMTVTASFPPLESVLACYDQRHENLIPILQDVQSRYGFLSEKAVSRIAEYLGLSPNDVYRISRKVFCV